MREWGIETWKWIAAGALTGILSLMMLTGLGSKRGTRLNRFRLALWAIVLGLGGVSGTTAGCSEQGFVSCYDPDGGYVEEEDAADPAVDVPVDGDEIEDSPRDTDDLGASGEDADEDPDLDASDDA